MNPILGLLGFAILLGWIVAVIEVLRTPSWQFYSADSNKFFWVCALLFLGIVGAVLWLVTARTRVLAASDLDAEAIPGWYPDDGSGRLRWWDGIEWTDRYDTWSGRAPQHS